MSSHGAPPPTTFTRVQTNRAPSSSTSTSSCAKNHSRRRNNKSGHTQGGATCDRPTPRYTNAQTINSNKQSNSTTNNKNNIRGKVLVLHGNRQTGQLLLGRMAKLRSTLLRQYGVELVALDAPFLYENDRDNENDTNERKGEEDNDKEDDDNDAGGSDTVVQLGGSTDQNATPPKNSMVPADAPQQPHLKNPQLRTWWHRLQEQEQPSDNNKKTYRGLTQSIALVQSEWLAHNNKNNTNSAFADSRDSHTVEREDATASSPPYMGLLGFSQGARMAHLLAALHETQNRCLLPGLKFVIMVSGYDAPWPNDDNDAMPMILSNELAPELASTIAAWPSLLAPNVTLVLDPGALPLLSIPSLHVWGNQDTLIAPNQSADVMNFYHSPEQLVHDGGHCVPMRAAQVQSFVKFIVKHAVMPSSQNSMPIVAARPSVSPVGLSVKHGIGIQSPITARQQTEAVSPIELMNNAIPDEENASLQREEIEVLQAIYPDEFRLISSCTTGNNAIDTDVTTIYQYPIAYTIDLVPENVASSFKGENSIGCWPPHPVRLHVTYSVTYPLSTPPILRLDHNNNGIQLTSHQTTACLHAVYTAAEAEQGMPCVLTCILAARDFFDSPNFDCQTGNKESNDAASSQCLPDFMNDETTADDAGYDTESPSVFKSVSYERIQQCNLQGLDIAEKLLYGAKHNSSDSTIESGVLDEDTARSAIGKGGSWLLSIGLVGKPSAGKSTFFNIATGFARQRQTITAGKQPLNTDHFVIGGAAMAAHPFTTISPNIGFALVPAPMGTCPEDNPATVAALSSFCIGASHGRDCHGRRFLPVQLKDVAGLVPNAYQGRGRGNQFLNDLCDADVLIHVCDASGMSDSGGNIVLVDDESTNGVKCSPSSQSESSTTVSVQPNSDSKTITVSSMQAATHPLEDMAWIRNELIEWVTTNLAAKWDVIRRKGRPKLAAMFSGYGQPAIMTWNVLNAVERYMDQKQERERALDHLEEWDAGDVRRLVSAFLGVRFPMAIALNKMDMPSSQGFIQDIQAALPIHGTHVGIPLSAKNEIRFVWRSMKKVLRGSDAPLTNKTSTNNLAMAIPQGTWTCLQSAMSLCEPVLAFPVMDHQTYAPLPGLWKFATSDPSLPSAGMVDCLEAAGGTAPSEWDSSSKQYFAPKANKTIPSMTKPITALRDAILLKPGSTVNDLFLTLQNLGALSGEFIRAEAAGEIGSLAKPIPKFEIITKRTRILKIMTNKRTTWQQS